MEEGNWPGGRGVEGPWEKKVKSRGRVCGSGMSWAERPPFAEMHAYQPETRSIGADEGSRAPLSFHAVNLPFLSPF
jgi:hypothetical protein